MGYETINVTPVTPRIGAAVDGLTLAKPLVSPHSKAFRKKSASPTRGKGAIITGE